MINNLYIHFITEFRECKELFSAFSEKRSGLYMNEIGERLAKWRKKNKLTLAEIKEKAKISTGNFSDLEKGKSIPSAKALISLKNEYNLDADWILFGEEKNSNDKYKDIEELFEQLTEEELFTMKYMIKKEYKEIIDQRVTSSVSKDTG